MSGYSKGMHISKALFEYETESKYHSKIKTNANVA